MLKASKVSTLMNNPAVLQSKAAATVARIAFRTGSIITLKCVPKIENIMTGKKMKGKRSVLGFRSYEKRFWQVGIFTSISSACQNRL